MNGILLTSNYIHVNANCDIFTSEDGEVVGFLEHVVEGI